MTTDQTGSFKISQKSTFLSFLKKNCDRNCDKNNFLFDSIKSIYLKETNKIYTIQINANQLMLKPIIIDGVFIETQGTINVFAVEQNDK